MKPEELRIGNFIDRNGLMEVKLIGMEKIRIYDHINKTHYNNGFRLDSFNGIPLTEEWLIKLGFERNNNKDNSDSFYAIACGICALHINPNNGVVWIYRDDKIFNNPALIENVHSLQNLYFALTGTELTLKP